MSAVDQIREAERYKEEGNQHFKEGDYKRALGAYHKVFCYINGLQPPPGYNIGTSGTTSTTSAPSSQIPTERVEDVKKLKQSAKLNMAACYLKVSEYQKCVDACAAALELGSSSKAHFRRGQAYAELRNFSGARTELEKARELAPEDLAIVRELRKVKAAFSKGNDKERRQCAKMLGETTTNSRSGAPPVGGSDAADAANLAAATPDAGRGLEELAGDGVAMADGSGAADVATKAAASSSQDLSAGAAPDASAGGGVEAIGIATSAAAKETSVSPSVLPPSAEVKDEARRLDVVVRELTYAWEQAEEHLKIYISFDQSEELMDGVDKSRVQVDYGEWSVLLVIQSAVEGRTPLGLRLGDLHRRIAPEQCTCTVRSSRITLKLVKQVKEHWWNLL